MPLCHNPSAAVTAKLPDDGRHNEHDHDANVWDTADITKMTRSDSEKAGAAGEGRQQTCLMQDGHIHFNTHTHTHTHTVRVSLVVQWLRTPRQCRNILDPQSGRSTHLPATTPGNHSYGSLRPSALHKRSPRTEEGPAPPKTEEHVVKTTAPAKHKKASEAEL